MQSSEVPGWHYASELPEWYSESKVLGWHSTTKVPGWHSALCRVPPRHIAPMLGQNRKFWPGESISLRNFTPVVCKVSPQDFFSVLVASRPKIPVRSFWPWCYQMVLLTGVRPKPVFDPFDRPATISLSRYFWPIVRLMGVNKNWPNF